jgi:hypothetical protein
LSFDEDHRRSMLAGGDVPDALIDSFERDGFLVVHGRIDRAVVVDLQRRYDQAFALADPADAGTSRSRGDTRVHDFVNRGAAFDRLWLDPLLVGLCVRALPRPFKLSSLLARTVRPGAEAQPLHVDLARTGDHPAMVGFIWMIDDFRPDNRATRLVFGSHLQTEEPQSKPSLATGPAGSLLVYDGAVWHGYSANRSAAPRRSIQGAFVPRSERQATVQSDRLLASTAARLDDLGRYLLDV